MADFIPRGQAIRETLSETIASRRVNRDLRKAKKARWKRAQARYHDRPPPDTSNWVQVDKSLSATIAALAVRAAPAVADSINKHFVPAFEDAQKKWPVRSGESRAALVLQYEFIGNDTLSVKMRSPADYTWYIKAQGVHIGSDLIINPGKAAAVLMADEVAVKLGA